MISQKLLCWSLSFLLLFAYSLTLVTADQYEASSTQAYAMEYPLQTQTIRVAANGSLTDWIKGMFVETRSCSSNGNGAYCGLSIFRFLPIIFAHIS